MAELTQMYTFHITLRRLREERGLSQTRLAASAGYDHSYASRLESGARTPTRQAVFDFAWALQLSAGERDLLLASALFMPLDRANVLADHPELAELARAILAGGLPEHVDRFAREQCQELARAVTSVVEGRRGLAA